MADSRGGSWGRSHQADFSCAARAVSVQSKVRVLAEVDSEDGDVHVAREDAAGSIFLVDGMGRCDGLLAGGF